MSIAEQTNVGLLPDGMVDWIETATDSRIVSLEPAVGAGVSREGCFVTLERGSEKIEAYLAYDVRRVDDVTRQDFSRREASALRLAEQHGLRVPHVLASWPERLAILTRRLPGGSSLEHLDDANKLKLAEQYIGEIARLHRIDVSGLELDGFGPPGPPDEYARKRIDFLKHRHSLNGDKDPLLALTYRWLSARLPQGDLPTVVVHGDVGPANFLHDEKQVTGVLDWEQTHYGDPMEDFGWLMLRSALFPFLPPALLMQAYERAGGHTLDHERIRYYRVLCLTGSATDMCTQLVQRDGPFAGHLGHVYAYYCALRKLLLEALAESERVPLPVTELPETSVVPWDRLYDLAEAEIEENIIPRSADAVGGARARSLIRLIRYWQGRERYGAHFDATEQQEIEQELGTEYASLVEARKALAEAIESEALPIKTAIRLCAARVGRDTAVAREGLGPLADSQWPPLG